MALTVKDMLATANAAVPRINQADAAAMIDKGALVVDLRDSTEIAASGKVPGAVAVSRGLLEFRADPDVPTHDANFRKDRPVIVYCASGGRAALAGKTLLDMGFNTVRNLGGFKDWAEAGGTVEK
jgi:rhodanese-related sulfurtransferase